ncbi:MAG TPA: retropepsin-like aspartic protease [Terriglobales bacterium]|nr:retropepsin-like aspartic protease [Terriglobales bacterium]
MKYRLFVVITLSLAASAQTIEFKLHDNYLILTKCSIAERQNLVALIDTGATETAVDSKLAKRLGLLLTADTATFGTGQAPASAVSIPELTVGPVHVTELSGIAVDGSRIERQLGVHADVIIGMDVLERSSLLIDYKAKTITFGAVPHLAHTSPLTRGKHLVLVPVLIGNRKLLLQLDTGLNGILIYGARIQTALRSLNSTSDTLVGVTSVQTASVPLRIANWEQRQAIIAVTDDQPNGALPFDGLLGPVAIGAHRIAFDWSKATMSWE